MFKIVYTDVKNDDEEKEELIKVEDTEKALELFVERRKEEGWSTADIFRHSSLRVEDQEENQEYVLSEYGELRKKEVPPI